MHVLVDRFPVGAYEFRQVSVGEESVTQVAANLPQDRSVDRVQIGEQPRFAFSALCPGLHLIGCPLVEGPTNLAIRAGIPVRLGHVVEERSLAAPGECRQGSDTWRFCDSICLSSAAHPGQSNGRPARSI